MVTGERSQHDIRVRVHIDGANVSLATIKINSIKSIIDPVDAPLILMSYPPHRRRQTREGRDTPVTAVIFANRLNNHRIATDMAVEPANSSIVTGCIISTIGRLT